MKKIILTCVMTLCLIIPAVFSLIGCGNTNSEYAGQYSVAEYVYSDYYEYQPDTEQDVLMPGDTITREEYQASPESYEHLDVSGWFNKTITLNSNYTFSDSQTGISFSIDGTWKVVDKNIILEVDGEEYMTLAINEDKTLSLTEYDSYSVNFEKI